MDTLRLILLLSGVIGIALLYFWSVFSQKKQTGKKTVHQIEPEIKLSNFHANANLQAEQEPVPSMSGLTEVELDLKQSISLGTNAAIPDTQEDKEQTTDLFPQDTGAHSNTEQAAPGEGQTEPLALHIMAPPTAAFSGTALLRALELVEMEHGEMNIFHHYGLQEGPRAQALFSLANMYEPGCFDLDSIDQASIMGLSLFLRRPSPVPPRTAFELMLKTTQRLARELGGAVCGAGRQPLGEDEIARLRHRLMTASAGQ